MEQIVSVRLSHTLENDLLPSCERRLPYETCGVLYGTTENAPNNNGQIIVDNYSIIRNTSFMANHSYSFHPEDWINVYFHAKKNQRNIVGFFHSHPLGAALPSLEDKQGSIPWKTYWIVSLAQGNRMITAYQRRSQEQWTSLPILRVP